MVQNLKAKIVFILLVLAGAVFVLYTQNINLGLDLSGGSSLRYKLPRPEDLPADKTMKEVLDETVDVFRKRIDGYGLKEIPIRAQGDDEILIELPGLSQAEVDDIVNIIQSQGNLEYLILVEDETDKEDESITVRVEEKRKALVDYLKGIQETKGGWSLDTDLSPLSFDATIDGHPARYFWLARSEDVIERELKLPVPRNSTFTDLGLDVEANPDHIHRYFELMKRYSDERWQFHGSDLVSVSRSQDEMRNPAVGFTFGPRKASDFGEFTEYHLNKRMAIVLDGRITSDPVIRARIPGSGIISGPQPKGFTLDEQKTLLTILRSGSIVVKPVLLFQNTIGPTLGDQAIERGKLAAIIGMGAVFTFLMVYYLYAGVIAALALAVNLVLLMGVLVFLQATLTLPGIAGIVLTVGMAVDANILIFERIREEKEKGKTIAQSIKNGFERAFVTIVDANATTFITGFILFQFGTGPVRGFAATLMIGICTSLFAALVVSKVVFAFLIERGTIKANLPMMRLLRNPNLNFPKAMPPAAVCSLVVILAGLVAFIMADDTKYGLDFTGGYNVHLKCVEGTTQGEVQTRLGSVFPNVQVVTVRKGTEVAETDPYEVFDVKIKSTTSQEEALKAEAEALRVGGTTRPEEPEDPTVALIGSSERYLAKIKELLKDVLVKDPIFDLTFQPDAENPTTTRLTFGLNLAKPMDEATLKAAFGEPFRIEELIFSEGGRVAQVNAVFTRSAELNAKLIKGRITTTLQQAARNGNPVELLDPFPLTGYIGPTVGHRLRDNAIIAIFFSLIAIIVYIRFRFKEYKYGIAAAVALVHDVLITLGAVAAVRLSGLVDVEIDLPLIAAFLTIIGYSLNDTIVVFDRVRENLPRVNLPFKELLNLSINQTLSRTVLTSLTTLLTVLLLFVLNYGQRNVMEGFSFALIVGVVVGTYSSIFVASPVLLLLHNREKRLAMAK